MFQKKTFQMLLSSLGATLSCALPDARFLIDDSREAGVGDYFVIRDGTTVMTVERAQQLANEAVAAGVTAIISHLKLSVPEHICFIYLEDTRHRLLELAQGFYGPIPDHLRLVAVTGTNGKTPTTYLVESIAQQMGLRVGVLGTISHRYPGYFENSENTTPGTLKLYKLLHGMVEAQCDLVVMEVSSHAICQDRIAGLKYDVAVWNNLGVDHLDYHKTREAYGHAKQQLFSKYLALSKKGGKHPVAIVNAMDADVMRLVNEANPQTWGGKCLTFSTDETVHADVMVVTSGWHDHAWRANLNLSAVSKEIRIPLVGRYNIANVAAACAALYALGYEIAHISHAISHVSQVPGRMQVVREAAPRVIVDFAHTPEALDSAIKATRETMTDGTLWVVFGCGGDRDASKRPLMARYAQEGADKVVVTSDNPRTEDPEAIIRNILEGVNLSSQIYVESDRRRAIHLALEKATGNHDVVLIAGKGHEDYQIIGTTKTHFSDVEEVLAFFKTR